MKFKAHRQPLQHEAVFVFADALQNFIDICRGSLNKILASSIHSTLVLTAMAIVSERLA